SPGVPITTNFMRFFKPCDYWKWAERLDFVSDDPYPDPSDPESVLERSASADLMRSLKQGRPWVVLEQAPNAVNWRRRNVPKHPGQLRLGGYQSLARGADGIMHFQWRASRAGAEKFHSGMLPHAGTATRTWREIVQLGGELSRLDDVLGTRVPAEVAFVFDWESWWALELPSKPAHDHTLLHQVRHWYRPLWRRNVTVDFVHPEQDLSRYRLVIVPNLYLVSDAGAGGLVTYAERGGTLVLSFFSGIVDSRDHVRLGGYPAPFRELLGIVVPEVWPHAEGEERTVRFGDDRYRARLWSDWIELEGAHAVATFEHGWLDGKPAVTRNGSAWYVGTHLARNATDRLVATLVDEAAVEPALETPPQVEAVRREGHGGAFLFLLNHGANEVDVALDGAYRDALGSGECAGILTLAPFDVAMLARAS
ncbi:MAG: beta-galactosidase, partial [Chloroflexi bacterium]